MSTKKTTEVVYSSGGDVSTSTRIRALRKSLGWTQTELATACGVSQGAVSNWEKGYDRPTLAALMVMAELAPDSDKGLWVTDAGVAQYVKQTPENTRLIPVLRDAAAAGTPRAVDEKNIRTTLALPAEFFRPGGKISGIPVEGDSMSPILETGYTAFVDTSAKDPAKLVGKMVAARDGEGGITLKWLRKQGDLYLLVPQHTSPRHGIQVMEKTGGWSIVGEVVLWIGTPPPVRK